MTIFFKIGTKCTKESSRATFYVNIAYFSPEVHLDSVKVLKFRTALAKLRVFSHRLGIEAGRRARPYKNL